MLDDFCDNSLSTSGIVAMVIQEEYKEDTKI